MLPRLCETALALLIPFATTYLCQSEFSTPLSKMRYRNRLNAQADMSIVISNIVPRFKKVISKKQEQNSYCDRKSRAACAQSFAPWQQATIEIMLARGGARGVPGGATAPPKFCLAPQNFPRDVMPLH